MTKREKILLFVTLAVVGLFALDRLVIVPVSAAFSNLEVETAAARTQLNEARTLVNRADRIEQRWGGYHAAGLGDDMNAAQARAQLRLTQWAQTAGLGIETLSTGRVVEGERFDEVSFIVSGTGSLASVERFLWEVRQADFPLRIERSDLASRNESEDALMFSLTLSTIVSAPPAEGEDAR